MDVLLNVESLAPPLAGIGRYTSVLVNGLRGRVDSLRCFAHLEWVSPQQALAQAEASSTGRVSGLREAIRKTLRGIPGAYPLRATLRDAAFWRLSRPFREAVYHEPNYILKPYAGPCVATVHDISHIHYPDFHPRERVSFMNKGLPRSLRRAQRIITVSDFVRAELIEYFGIQAEKVVTVPLGVNHHFRPRPAGEIAPTLARNGLTCGGYLLAVGTLEPRKNLAGLVDAFAQLPLALRKRFPLVLVGAHGWGHTGLEHRLAPLEARGEARRLGYVSQRELPAVYAGAAGFAFPSIYEGFGLPPLEAAACGVPVLTSARASMPEVVGDVALLVDPQDPESLRAGLERLLTDDSFRQWAAKAGVRRASRFTWQACIDHTLDVYRVAARM